ncbi:MAG: ATP-binding protein [Eubacterium sp.]|nr:ATP-binding protein [Eubacterium sp.]
MLQRKMMRQLMEWKRSRKKDCLLVHGVRQCGKTYLIREFGKAEYRNLIEINFIRQPDMADAFGGSLAVDDLIRNLTFIAPELRFVPGETLLFLDEIQECPNARTSLKFWAEDGRFDVIASGSLLGIQYRNITSIPVGYETQVKMYPLDFEEYLWAKGVSPEAVEGLRTYLDGEHKIPEAIHTAMLRYYREYMVTGGMPDVVNTLLETGDYREVQRMQDRLLADYRDDIAKYAENSVRIKAQACYASIPGQLTKDNHKFQYSAVERKGTARKFENSLEWLEAAGMVYRSRNLSLPAFPLRAYEKPDQFRLYLSDIGLFTAMFGFQMKAAILNDTLTGPAKGGIYESAVADLLAKKDRPLYYYKREDSTLEIEFFLEEDAAVVPLEVKANRGSTRSLNELLKDAAIGKGYKLTAQNTGRDGKKITLPMYLAMFL